MSSDELQKQISELNSQINNSQINNSQINSKLN